MMVVLGLFSCAVHAMEEPNDCSLSQWRNQKLSILLEESKQPAASLHNQQVRALKKKFVDVNQDKYELQQEHLQRLCLSTGGKVQATHDSELAQEDPNKFLSLGALEFTANEIDARWELIQQADCKNRKSQSAATQN